MKFQIPILKFAACLFLVLISSCKKEDNKSNNNSSGQNDDQFSLYSTWTCSNADLPTKSMRDLYKDFILVIREQDMSYSWKWNKKDGTVTEYTGYIAQGKTKYNHTNGEALYAINVNVTHINGNPAPGGWVGLYVSTGVKSMILNVEPNVSGVKPPSDKAGIGSGQSGNDAVFIFKR